jgi:hypothetical protein
VPFFLLIKPGKYLVSRVARVDEGLFSVQDRGFELSA